MEILSFNTLPSTQQYLMHAIAKKELHAPVAVLAKQQTSGVGSRDNSWEGGEGNFFVSMAIPLELLPSDLPLRSASIYFSFIMRKILSDKSEKVWLKWPNDLYIGDEKIGGTITQKVGTIIVCGMGINLKKSQNGYSALDLDIQPDNLLKEYISALEKFPEWKHIFSQYEVEFASSRRFSVHIENNK
ncbi:MAG TPA: biotin--[acetyl-CoA-carboxylase] ligase, partial [Epsilonproteobacteria bacterium]|nr:biotin--[acetyl-CoA-carboxylase] ligase [Campylobacterota bacterium]